MRGGQRVVNQTFRPPLSGVGGGGTKQAIFVPLLSERLLEIVHIR